MINKKMILETIGNDERVLMDCRALKIMAEKFLDENDMFVASSQDMLKDPAILYEKAAFHPDALQRLRFSFADRLLKLNGYVKYAYGETLLNEFVHYNMGYHIDRDGLNQWGRNYDREEVEKAARKLVEILSKLIRSSELYKRYDNH